MNIDELRAQPAADGRLAVRYMRRRLRHNNNGGNAKTDELIKTVS